MKKIYVTMAAIIAASSAMAFDREVTQHVSKRLTPEAFGPVEVKIEDLATNGCWTNIEEVRSNAVASLGREGFEVIANSKGKFLVKVEASRRNGACLGRMTFRFSKTSSYGDIELGHRSANCLETQICNPSVSYELLLFIDAIKFARQGYNVTE
ncbi:hypothetical protein [Aliiroseovarius sp. PrR006]|uniref:hypothetical protein n=1 Tax=Aliiroseovarius sp. PrR006 TaxID=2706883 RepID=UPI0013D350F2|nr:hypothetical protein [Aliiroseovarius sp. PrR006]NDW54343.1 hypothetical protein [Aliiroseovarius sp. PrR006]